MADKFIFLFLFVYACCAGEGVRQEYLNLPEGAKCTYDGVDGVCAGASSCLSAMEDIRNNKYPPICKFSGVKPIICCTDCELYKDEEPILINPGVAAWFYKTGKKARDNCLNYLDTLDYNCKGQEVEVHTKEKHPEKNCYVTKNVTIPATGEKDKREQFRHLALLGYGEDKDTVQWECVGSVLSDRFILTSARCLVSWDPRYEARRRNVKFVALGVVKRSDPPELWQHYDVKRTIASPEYQPPLHYHDIGLIETATTISFNERVRPACLHIERTNTDKFADVITWSESDYPYDSKDAVEAVRSKVGYDYVCMQYYPDNRGEVHGYDHDIQMCYGRWDDQHENLIDVETGESGAPIQNQQHFSPCVTTILGVSNGRRGVEGIAVRVSHYVPWLESVVWPSEEKNTS